MICSHTLLKPRRFCFFNQDTFRMSDRRLSSRAAISCLLHHCRETRMCFENVYTSHILECVSSSWSSFATMSFSSITNNPSTLQSVSSGDTKVLLITECINHLRHFWLPDDRNLLYYANEHGSVKCPKFCLMSKRDKRGSRLGKGTSDVVWSILSIAFPSAVHN